MQACAFRDNYEVIVDQKAIVLGVSPDGVASHVKFKSKYNLPFTLLVDADHQIAEAYGVWGEKTILLVKFTGVLRSHFVIGPEGRIIDAQYNIGAKDSAERALHTLAQAHE